MTHQSQTTNQCSDTKERYWFQDEPVSSVSGLIKSAGRCGSCADYWSLEGQSILPYWNEPDRAGTCCWSTFRLFNDEPIMNCWSAISHD